MSNTLEDWAQRVWAPLILALGAVVTVVLPSLLLHGSGLAGSVAMTALVTAVVSLAAAGVRCMACPERPSPIAVRSTSDGASPWVAGRATDPAHHPLRPRAPGLI